MYDKTEFTRSVHSAQDRLFALARSAQQPLVEATRMWAEALEHTMPFGPPRATGDWTKQLLDGSYSYAERLVAEQRRLVDELLGPWGGQDGGAAGKRTVPSAPPPATAGWTKQLLDQTYSFAERLVAEQGRVSHAVLEPWGSMNGAGEHQAQADTSAASG